MHSKLFDEPNSKAWTCNFESSHGGLLSAKTYYRCIHFDPSSDPLHSAEGTWSNLFWASGVSGRKHISDDSLWSSQWSSSICGRTMKWFVLSIGCVGHIPSIALLQSMEGTRKHWKQCDLAPAGSYWARCLGCWAYRCEWTRWVESSVSDIVQYRPGKCAVVCYTELYAAKKSPMTDRNRRHDTLVHSNRQVLSMGTCLHVADPDIKIRSSYTIVFLLTLYLLSLCLHRSGRKPWQKLRKDLQGQSLDVHEM